MKELAYYSGYVGSSNIPAITLANKLIELAYDNMQAVFFTSGGAESNESAFKTARFYWKAQGQARQGQDHRPPAGLSRRHAAGDERHRHGAPTGRCSSRVSRASCTSRRAIRTGSRARSPARRSGQAAARELEEAILREGPTRWRRSSASRSTAAAASSIRPTTTGRWCARSARATTCSSSPTRSSRASAARARWFALAHWNVKPDIVSFAKGVTSGYLPLGGIMVIEGDQGGDGRRSSPRTAGCTPTPTRAIRPAARSASRTSRSWSASGSGRTRRRWARACCTACRQAFSDHRNVGDIRGGKGLLAAVELVEDRGDEGELRRPTGRSRSAHPGRDDEARRRHAHAAGGRPASGAWRHRSTSRRRSSSPRRRSTGSVGVRATQSRSCLGV